MTDMTNTPERFVVHESGGYVHGTKADLRVGDLTVPGHPSNYEPGRISNDVYMTRVLDGAALAAEMSLDTVVATCTSLNRKAPSRTTRMRPTRSFLGIRLTLTAAENRCGSSGRSPTGRGIRPSSFRRSAMVWMT